MAEITKEQFLPSQGAGTVAKEGDVVSLPTGRYKMTGGQFVVQQEAPTAPAPTPTATTTPESPKETPRYNIQNLQPAQPTYQSEADIRSSLDSQYQAAVGAIKQKYADLIQQSRQAGEKQLGRTRATAAASGVLGQDFGTAQLGEQEKLNQQDIANLESQQAQEIGAIGQKQSEEARQRFTEERAFATAQSEKNIQRTIENIQNVAAQGKLEDLPQSTVQTLFQNSGFSTPEEFQAYYNAARSAALNKNVTISGNPKEGIWKLKTDPVTGDVTAEQVVKPQAETEPVKLGQGETLVNPQTGKVVAEGPVKHSTAYQEWEDYKSTGGTLGFNEYQTMDANRKKSTTIVNMTPQQQDATLNGMITYYKTTGQLPSFPYGAAGVPLRQAFWTAVGTGGNVVSDAVANKAAISSQTAALRTQEQQLAGTKTSLNTLDNQLDLLAQYSNKTDRTGSPLINKYLLWTKGQIQGDSDTQAMQNIVKTASMEFAKIMSGSAASIAGATVSSASDAEKLLNANLSPQQLNEVIKVMKQEGQFRLKNQQQTINDLSNDLKGNITGTTETGNIDQDISDDIKSVGKQFKTREELISALAERYPEKTPQEIGDIVYKDEYKQFVN